MCPTVYHPMDCSIPGSFDFHYLPGVCSDLYLLGQWCYITISSYVSSHMATPQPQEDEMLWLANLDSIPRPNPLFVQCMRKILSNRKWQIAGSSTFLLPNSQGTDKSYGFYILKISWSFSPSNSTAIVWVEVLIWLFTIDAWLQFMLLSCDTGEESWESFAQQGNQDGQF